MVRSCSVGPGGRGMSRRGNCVNISLTGYVMYFNTRVVDRVFPASGRNYPAHLVGGAPAGQVSALYHDTRLAVRLDNGLCAEYPLQVSSDSGGLYS